MMAAQKDPEIGREGRVDVLVCVHCTSESATRQSEAQSVHWAMSTSDDSELRIEWIVLGRSKVTVGGTVGHYI